MAAETLEERLTTVEQELAQLKQQLQAQALSSSLPWWEKIAGTFARSEHYDEAMRLGREYRESLRPKTMRNLPGTCKCCILTMEYNDLLGGFWRLNNLLHRSPVLQKH